MAIRALTFLLLCVAACTPLETPRNLEPVETGGSYQAQLRALPPGEDQKALASAAMNRDRCTPETLSDTASATSSALSGEILSRGDLLRVLVADDETLSGDYVVSGDGRLRIPFAQPVAAAGRSPRGVERALAETLVREGLYDQTPLVAVLIRDFAAARVHVEGAVFDPGTFEIGQVGGENRDDARVAALGAATEGRSMSTALRFAGGVRPDADLSRVSLTRGGRRYVLDMRGAINGRPFPDPMLAVGDAVSVPSRGCFQEELAAPTPVTPPGVRVFMSNLIRPALNNASAAIGRDVRELRYGSTFLQAAFDLNCIGGAAAVDADRHAVLLTRNPLSGQSVVIERDLETLLRRADRDDFDPLLMPGTPSPAMTVRSPTSVRSRKFWGWRPAQHSS